MTTKNQKITMLTATITVALLAVGFFVLPQNALAANEQPVDSYKEELLNHYIKQTGAELTDQTARQKFVQLMNAHDAIGKEMERFYQETQTFGKTRAITEDAPNRLPITLSYIDPEAGTLMIGIEQGAPRDYKVYEQRLRAIIGHDIPIKLASHNFEDDTCNFRTSGCSPMYGGLKVDTGIPSIGWSTMTIADTTTTSKKGFVMSGHGAGIGTTGKEIGQPDMTRKVGDVITNPNSPRSCDCAFVEFKKNSSGQYIHTGDEAKIYKADFGSTFTVIGKKTSTEAGITTVRMSGAGSNSVNSGTVHQIGVTVNSDSGTFYNQVLATYASTSGDSGAPVFSGAGNSVDLYGIHKGRDTFNGVERAIYSPWEHMKSELSLTS